MQGGQTPIAQFWSFPANQDDRIDDGDQRRPLISLPASATDRPIRLSRVGYTQVMNQQLR